MPKIRSIRRDKRFQINGCLNSGDEQPVWVECKILNNLELGIEVRSTIARYGCFGRIVVMF